MPGAAHVALFADGVANLNAATVRIGVRGDRHNAQHMGLVGR